ncbi:MAG: hypothetical protein RSC36_06405, partial [Ruthenibacterium sp.]
PAPAPVPPVVTAPPVNAAPEFGDMSGTVQNITGDTLTMTGDDGNTYTLNVSGASRQYANGIQAGNPIELHYSGALHGTDTSGVTVLTIVDNASNAPLAGMIRRGV